VDLLLHKAEATYRLGQEQEALNLFESVLHLVADQPEMSEKVLDKLTRVGHPEKVLAWGRQKLQQRPNWTTMRLVLAGIYRNQKNYVQEIAELKAARASAASDSASNPERAAQVTAIEKQMTLTYLANGRWQEAIDLSRQLITKEPENADLLNNLAYALMEVGGHDAEAVQAAKQAYELDRTDTNIMDTYAMALLRTKDYATAETVMLRAIQTAQRIENRVPPEYEYHLAQAMQGLGRIPEAQSRLQRIMNQLQSSQAPEDIKWRDRITALQQELAGQRQQK
jgi:tetratricopeptide (TPR) repeat protein